MNTIQKEWQSYKQNAYPAVELSPLQEQECSQAFYAGAASMLHILRTIAECIEDDNVAVAASERIIEELKAAVEGTL